MLFFSVFLLWLPCEQHLQIKLGGSPYQPLLLKNSELQGQAMTGFESEKPGRHVGRACGIRRIQLGHCQLWSRRLPAFLHFRGQFIDQKVEVSRCQKVVLYKQIFDGLQFCPDPVACMKRASKGGFAYISWKVILEPFNKDD